MAVSAKEYRSWSFTDKSFLFAVAVSILWHLFWFFSVTIVVTPGIRKKPVDTTMVSLGPVLDDTIFRTLVESRPEFSQAFYRETSEFESATELPVETAERYESGGMTSLPGGKNFVRLLRDLVGGDKTSAELPSLSPTLPTGDSYFDLAGEVYRDQILSRPVMPDIQDPRSVEMEFEVDEAGGVASVMVASSSGDPVLDRQWEDHLRQWLFSPAPSIGGSELRKGRVVFRRGVWG